MSGILPMALAAAAVLLAVTWSLRSARRIAEAARASSDAAEDSAGLAALPSLQAGEREGLRSPPHEAAGGSEVASPDPGPSPGAAPASSPPADAPVDGPRRSPLVPIAGAAGGAQARRTAEGTGGALMALLGVPEAVGDDDLAPRPSASDLPRLRWGSASPFEGPGLELEALEDSPDEPKALASRAPPAPSREAGRVWGLAVGPVVGLLWWFLAPHDALQQALHAALSAVAAVVAGLLFGLSHEALARARQERFERDLQSALDDAEAGAGPGPAEALLNGWIGRYRTGAVLGDEAAWVLQRWWPEADRHQAIEQARSRRGVEWARVLFALDEAERTAVDPSPLLRHTADVLRSRREAARSEPSQDRPGLGVAIAIVLLAIAAGLGMAL